MLFQEAALQKPRSLPNELPMFLGDDQAQIYNNHQCISKYSRPRGWSDVALGALFEMDFDMESSADGSVARSCPTDIQEQAQRSCCFEREEKSLSVNGCFDGEIASTVVCKRVSNAGRELADNTLAEDAATSGASQSWSCLTQRDTATPSVAIKQRKQPSSWRPPNTTR
jgi:hypothetical protein